MPVLTTILFIYHQYSDTQQFDVIQCIFHLYMYPNISRFIVLFFFLSSISFIKLIGIVRLLNTIHNTEFGILIFDFTFYMYIFIYLYFIPFHLVVTLGDDVKSQWIVNEYIYWVLWMWVIKYNLLFNTISFCTYLSKNENKLINWIEYFCFILCFFLLLLKILINTL